MTWVLVGLFVSLSVFVGVKVRRDIRRAVERRHWRRRVRTLRRAEVHSAMVAIQGFGAQLAEVGAAAQKAAASLQKFGEVMRSREAARTSPFQPSARQKGAPRV